MKNRPLEPSKTFWGHKGKAGRSVGVSCRDFVPPEKAWPFQVVQVGGIAEKPRAFGRMPPTMHESTKHQQRGRRPVSIDRFPKNNGSGVPGSLPFHEKYVAHPQKSFRSDPFFKRGRRVQGGVLQGRLDCQAGALRRAPGIGGRRLWKECFLGGTHSFGSTA